MTPLRIMCLFILMTNQSLSLEEPVTNTTFACCPDTLFVDGNNTWCRNKTTWIPLSIHCSAENFSTPLGSEGDTLYHNGTHLIKYGYKVFEKKYCLGKQKCGSVAVICFDNGDHTELPVALKHTLGVISIIGCILTAITYACVGKIRDVLGKSTIALCIALPIGLAATALHEAPALLKLHECAVIAFTAQVFMLAAFFWMNAIAIQVYRMFANKQPSDRAFIWYSLYAWGSATLILIITLIVNFAPNSRYSPEIGIDVCWFAKNESRWIFLLIPMGVLMIINLCLFVAVWVKYHNLYKNVESDRKKLLRYSKVMSILVENPEFDVFSNKELCNVTTAVTLHKERVLLFVRLLVVMGVSWLGEIVAELFTERWLWYIADSINLLQGAFIFIFLVLLGKKAQQGLAERGRLCCFNGILKRRETVREYIGCDELKEEQEEGGSNNPTVKKFLPVK